MPPRLRQEPARQGTCCSLCRQAGAQRGWRTHPCFRSEWPGQKLEPVLSKGARVFALPAPFSPKEEEEQSPEVGQGPPEVTETQWVRLP